MPRLSQGAFRPRRGWDVLFWGNVGFRVLWRDLWQAPGQLWKIIKILLGRMVYSEPDAGPTFFYIHPQNTNS